MHRREFLTLCGLAAGFLAENCHLKTGLSGPRPAEAPDLATLACLQNRLNELGQNLAIEIREW